MSTALQSLAAPHIGQASHSGATILVVDDDPLIRLLIRDLLEPMNYEIVEAGDGKEACLVCKRVRVDLVLIDLFMPEREGIETIQQLRREYAELPIVAISGAFDGRLLKTAKCLGANAAVQKPFTYEQLLYAVEAHISRPPSARRAAAACAGQDRTVEQLTSCNLPFATRHEST